MPFIPKIDYENIYTLSSYEAGNTLPHPNKPPKHTQKNRWLLLRREIFVRAKVWERRNTLCISSSQTARPEKKIRRRAIRYFREYAKHKKGAGRCFAPHFPPVSLSSESRCCFASRRRSGGQNLAALSTAAGENLAAVGSSHSLAETVNLGTMTTAGLIGTLHEYTSCQNGFHMLDSHKDRSNT